MNTLKAILNKAPIGILHAVYAVSAFCMSVLSMTAILVGIYFFSDIISYGGLSTELYELMPLVYDFAEFLSSEYHILIMVILSFVISSIFLWHALKVSNNKAASVIRMVFRINITVFIAVSAGIVIGDLCSYDYFIRTIYGQLVLSAAVLAGALIGELLTLLLMRRNQHACWKDFILLFTVAVFTIGMFGLIKLDVTGAQRYIPQMEDIISVSIGDVCCLEDPENIEKIRQLNAEIIDSRAENEHSDCLEEVSISYWLNGENSLKRCYYMNRMTGDGYSKQVKDANEIINSRKVAEDWYIIQDFDEYTYGYASVYGLFRNPEEYIHDLTEDQFRDLYKNCIEPDIMDGKLGICNIISNDNDYMESVSGTSVYVLLYNKNGESETYLFSVDMKAERTLKWIEENTDAVVMTRKEYFARVYY